MSLDGLVLVGMDGNGNINIFERVNTAATFSSSTATSLTTGRPSSFLDMDGAGTIFAVCTDQELQVFNKIAIGDWGFGSSEAFSNTNNDPVTDVRFSPDGLTLAMTISNERVIVMKDNAGAFSGGTTI